jgi:hypothetical protein
VPAKGNSHSHNNAAIKDKFNNVQFFATIANFVNKGDEITEDL